jgi:HlyD family secretion protein
MVRALQGKGTVMDVQRRDIRGRRLVRWLGIGTVVVSAAGISFAVNRLRPALPSVAANTLWIDSVRHGPMLRQITGLGTLVPEEVSWVSAQTDGRIEKIHVQVGATVKPDTVIMELSNPGLTESMLAAQFDLKQAEANLTDLKAALESAAIDKQVTAAQVGADFAEAKLAASRDQQLGKLGLIPDLSVQLSQDKAKQLEFRNGLEIKRLGATQQSFEAQLAAQRVKIEQLTAVYELKEQEVTQLRVRAGTNGILQQLGNANPAGTIQPLEIGQNVNAGSILAKIAQQNKLKAQVKVTETDAKDLVIGQAASVDTHNGVAQGKISRIDPSAVGGTVTVDITFDAALPPGARPDLSVDGTIDIERVSDALYMPRPTIGQPNGTVTLFRVDENGLTASRRTVRLGRASANNVQILSGVSTGDRVILSDTSSLNVHDRIKLN